MLVDAGTDWLHAVHGVDPMSMPTFPQETDIRQIVIGIGRLRLPMGDDLIAALEGQRVFGLS